MRGCWERFSVWLGYGSRVPHSWKLTLHVSVLTRVCTWLSKHGQTSMLRSREFHTSRDRLCCWLSCYLPSLPRRCSRNVWLASVDRNCVALAVAMRFCSLWARVSECSDASERTYVVLRYPVVRRPQHEVGQKLMMAPSLGARFGPCEVAAHLFLCLLSSSIHFPLSTAQGPSSRTLVNLQQGYEQQHRQVLGASYRCPEGFREPRKRLG